MPRAICIFCTRDKESGNGEGVRRSEENIHCCKPIRTT